MDTFGQAQVKLMDTFGHAWVKLWTLWTGLHKTYGHFGQAWVQLMDTLDRLG